MYAIVKTGGKQYRVEKGQSLLVEKLAGDSDRCRCSRCCSSTAPRSWTAAEDLARVKVSARVVAQERGPKLRVVKFKPKRGYKRRTGHRQDLTRIEVTDISLRSAVEGSRCE